MNPGPGAENLGFAIPRGARSSRHEVKSDSVKLSRGLCFLSGGDRALTKCPTNIRETHYCSDVPFGEEVSFTVANMNPKAWAVV